jgi:hypothetical protein
MTDAYGLLAEFPDPAALIAAVERVRAAGYRRMEAYTPFPVDGLAGAVGLSETRIRRWGLAGGVFGAAAGFLMQVYAATDYPLNVGGRPVVPVTAFMVVTFELAILFAVTAAIAAMFVLNRLPRLNHPLFNARRFHLASRDRFFLCVERDDPRYDAGGTRALLESLNPVSVTEVPA